MLQQAIPEGSVIGIIGGGQLGRMLAQAATDMGYNSHIYCPEAGSPATQLAEYSTIAAYDDNAALERFAASVDVVTFEFENIPQQGLLLLEKAVPVRPSARWLYLCRNRLREKNFVNKSGIATTEFAAVNSEAELRQALLDIPPPAILKTTELGYDGKGQVMLQPTDDATAVWQRKLGGVESILEARVDFELEISVIVARSVGGEIKTFPPAHNIHKNHILDRSIVPAPIDTAIAKEAENIALTLAEAGDLVGLLAVEMFLRKDGKLLVNELAPRPHNSGHWTMDGCRVSQFAQMIRAICGLPLQDTDILHPTEMKNLIGEEVKLAEEYTKRTNARVHLYGKKEIRPGRKMGHVNLW